MDAPTPERRPAPGSDPVDAESAGPDPAGSDPATAPATWAPLGTVDAGVLARLDPAGRVQVGGATWSLEWWVGAEDGWHRPAEEVAVRQRILGESPVVETALRVPGGDVVQRAYGVQAGSGDWDGPGVVVEVENRTAVPVALALVLRPVRVDGAPGVLPPVGGGGPVVELAGTPAVVLARTPARVVQGSVGVVAERLAAGDDAPALVPTETAAQDHEVALVVPLAHTAVARALLPLPPPPRRGGRRQSAATAAVVGPTWSAPGADAVAAGWAAHTDDMCRAVLSEPGWDAALAWSMRTLLVAGADEVTASLDPSCPTPPGAARAVRVAEVCEALARAGAPVALDPVAAALAEVQRLGGEVRLADRSDGGVALLHAAASVLAAPFGAVRADELIGPVAKVVHRLRRGRGTGDDPVLVASAVRALRTVAPALVAVDQPDVAADALRAAEAVAATGAPVGGPGAGTGALGAALAVRAGLAAGRDGAVEDLRRLLGDRPVGGRAEPVDGHPPVGFDVAEVGARCSALLDLLALDGLGGPDLLPVWPAAWSGRPQELHGLRTAWGRVSFALRWHGDRPALLWEIRPHEGLGGDTALLGATAPRVRATGLDPHWVGAGWEGEALLAPHELPEEPRGVAMRVEAPIRRRPAGPGGTGGPEGQSFS